MSKLNYGRLCWIMTPDTTMQQCVSVCVFGFDFVVTLRKSAVTFCQLGDSLVWGGVTYITDKIQISKYRIDVLTFENFDFDTDFSARLFILSVCVTDKHPAHLRSTYWFTYKYALRLMCCCVLSPWQIDHLCYLQTCLCCLDHACLTSNQLLINEHMRSLHK